MESEKLEHKLNLSAASADVLIVGAGPTGLLLAAELAKHGIKPRLIDKNPQPSDKSKAIAVFPRTIEIFDELGVAEEAIKRGRRLHGVNYYGDGKRITHISTDGIDSFFPFVLCLPQSETEEILGRLVESLGVKIERSVTFTALKQDADGVTVTLSHFDGKEESCRVAWLVGCDGAHSPVRKQAGMADQGINIASPFVLADVEIDWDLYPNEIHAFFGSNGVLAAFPLPQQNYWRLIADLPPNTEPPENLELQFFQQLVTDRTHLKANLTNPVWLSSFRIRQRQVENCYVGRVFVAGDALSSHSPVGGQGMNTGLQDAYNLAWKLALVIRNQAGMKLLDSYQVERESVSKSLLTATELATRMITQHHPVFKQIRQSLVGFLTSFDSVQQFIGNTLSELKVNYRHSPIVQEDYSLPLSMNLQSNLIDWFDFYKEPLAGDRAPDVMIQTVDGEKSLFHVLSSQKHNLLLFSGEVTSKANYLKLSQIAQEVEEKFGNYTTAHLVLLTAQIPEETEWRGSMLLDPQAECHHRYSAKGECLYLLRPDSYIGYRSQPADADKLKVYLQKFYRWQG